MYSVVGFLSRPHGLNVLKALIDNSEYKILKIYTHSLNPKSQDPKRSERKEFKKIFELCKENNIDLTVINEKIELIMEVPNCDFIVEVSWRYLIPKRILEYASILAFGIHRGKLPEYAGAEPIKQALEKNEKEIVLSAHYLEDKIDSGGTIDTISFKIENKLQENIEEKIQRIRDDITPLFSKLTLITLKKFHK